MQSNTAHSSDVCPTHLIADQIATKDAFQHAAIANAIAEMILTEDRSCAIALTGTWGSGKSTVVNLLRLRLESTSDEIGIFVFDAWAHQGDPLRRTFLEKLTAWCNEQPGEWTKDKKHWQDLIDQLAKRMLLAWQEGVNSLRDRRVYSVGDWSANKVFEGISDAPRLESPQSVVGPSPLLAKRSRVSRRDQR